MLGVTRFGLARYGKVWVSRLGTSRPGSVLLDAVRYGFLGQAESGTAGSGKVR